MAIVRRTILLTVASAALFGTSAAALASAGCTALNGSYVGGALSGNITGAGFDAGDTITLTVNAAGGIDALGLYNDATHNAIILSTNAPGTQTYTLPAATSDQFRISGMRSNAGSDFTWSCAAVASIGASGVQDDGTKIVSDASASAISGATGDETDQALNQSNAPSEPAILSREEFFKVWMEISERNGLLFPREKVEAETLRMYDGATAAGYGFVGSSWGGIRMVTLPEPQSAVSSYFPQKKSDAERYVDDVFASLTANAFKLRANIDPQWSTWADIRLSGFQHATPNTLSGIQMNALAGVTYTVKPGVVVGAFAGYEAFNYEFAALSGNLKGGGATLGTYAGINVTPTLRWKGSLALTGLGYDTNDGAATGNFNGSRLLLSTGLTGKVDLGDYLVEPSADILALWEHQSAYTDSLGTAHAERSVSNGRIAVGSKVTANQWSDAFTPYLGLYADWRFASANAAFNDGWSARITGGLNIPVSTSGSLSLGGEYGGIGADYKVWSGNAKLAVQF